ncbi:MAG: hypothetical protein ACTHNG_01630 [Ginsengibacter sp.]
MKKVLVLIALVSSSFSINKIQSGKELITKMHQLYAGKWYKSFQFKQTTERYRNDSLISSQVWTEHIQFPENFRIDFGDVDSGNAVIFKNDSSYIFTNGKLMRTSYYPNDLLFLLGGIYFYPLDTAIAKFQSFGFDINKFHVTNYEGKKVYVIGADEDGEETNQAWFDSQHFNLVRMIKYDNKHKEDALLQKHVKLDGGFSETLVKFYLDDKLLQVEKYFDLKANVAMDPKLFDTNNFVKTAQQ